MPKGNGALKDSSTRLWNGSLCWGRGFHSCGRGCDRWGIGGRRSWSTRECWRDGGCIAGHGRKGQRHNRQLNGTHLQQFAIDPAAFVLFQRCVRLIERDLEPGRFFIARAEKKTGVY